jgi:argininosuccinate lyase
LVDALTIMKGTPLTFNRDFQEDKRSLWRTCDTLKGMLEVIPPLIAEVGIDHGAAARGFEDGFIFATDVAEHLVERGVPFRKSHEIVGNAVRWCVENGRALTSLSANEWKKLAPEAGEELPSLLTPERSAARRDTAGGASPRQVRFQAERGWSKLGGISAEFDERRGNYPNLLA